MSRHIIAAVRHLPQLRGSLYLTAIELAHRADGYNGIVTISYSYLASKCHCSRRTAIRHINRLFRLGIISCTRYWRPGNQWLMNRYQFKITWERPKPRPEQMSSSDKVPLKFPENSEREKKGSLGDQEKGKQMVLSWLTPGSAVYRAIDGET